MTSAHRTRFVLHIAPIDAVAQARESHQHDKTATYVDDSLTIDGFIHCSTVSQVLIPANERFAGRDDLVLLEIDLDLVPARTIFEDCYESGHAFPHIYGPIPVAAVTQVVPFPCEADGSFQLPDGFSPST